MGSPKLRGVWAAVVTPVDAAFRPDAERALPYYRELLANGCDGLNVFGTTGEAMSFGERQRRSFMEAVAASGLPMDRVMTGTGAASLDEAARLTRAAVELGFAAVLLMPPFFYRDAGDDGILRFFDVLFAQVPLAPGKAILYNFPAMSGITFHAGVVDRLMREFPGVIGGLKDSSNDRTLQAALHKRHPGLTILPGSEEYLADAVAGGAAGCISGSVALWPELAQLVFSHPSVENAAALAASRAALSGFPFIASVRACIARSRNDDAWRAPVPPLVPLASGDERTLTQRLDAARR